MSATKLTTHIGPSARLVPAIVSSAPIEPETRSLPPWHDVPIYEGRDLASEALWEFSLALARAKRRLARNPPRLPKIRRASVSLVAAAVAAATPALSSAHTRSAGKVSTAARSLNRALLQLGDQGAAVARLQRTLGISADGIFGRQTLKAVRTFQKREGLTVDGVVGPQTRLALARSGGGHGRASLLEHGDRGPAVARLQRALGISADGIFGRQTLKAVRTFQKREGLTVDGIVGSQTRAALTRGGGEEQRRSHGESQPPEQSHTHEQGQKASAVSGVDERLAGALALADKMGLTLISAYRPGAIIESSGQPSDHGTSPSKAIDVQGSAVDMRRYARAVAGTEGVETVIHSPVGIWTAGSSWHAIRTQITYETHIDHVHVDTF